MNVTKVLIPWTFWMYRKAGKKEMQGARDLQTQLFIMSCIVQIFQFSYFDLKANIV